MHLNSSRAIADCLIGLDKDLEGQDLPRLALLFFMKKEQKKTSSQDNHVDGSQGTLVHTM